MSLVFKSYSQKTFDEKHIEVSLRMIGHQLLLDAQDSTSRVLPILKDGDQYRIQFETEFDFKSEELVLIVSQVMEEANISQRYILEVEQCETREIIYSFEINDLEHKDIIACESREQPRSCYSLLLTILEKPQASTTEVSDPIATGDLNNPLFTSAIAASFILLGFVSFAIWRKTKRSSNDSRIIKLGKYRFDQRNAILIMKEHKTELTSKEVDLLQLLYSSVNSVVKREAMLHKVWGDEGNYIGRTLDVFISKLRGKLQADPAVKIVNIRGVGYKLVIGE